MCQKSRGMGCVKNPEGWGLSNPDEKLLRVPKPALRICMYMSFFYVSPCSFSITKFWRSLIYFQADPVNLRTFLSVLKLGDRELGNVKLSSLSPIKATDVEKPKTEMTIRRRGDYPLSKPFPSSLRKLAVNNCGLLRVDHRICRLQGLISLNLATNQIKELPSRFVSLSKLTELILSGNKLKEFPTSLCTGALGSSLKSLDLSNNDIKLLPSVFCSLKNLVHLKLDGNGLCMLPPDMGKLVNLHFFSASHNQLRVLPISFVKLRLDSVDVSGNPFLSEEHWKVINNLSVPSLRECAGRVIKNNR